MSCGFTSPPVTTEAGYGNIPRRSRKPNSVAVAPVYPWSISANHTWNIHLLGKQVSWDKISLRAIIGKQTIIQRQTKMHRQVIIRSFTAKLEVIDSPHSGLSTHNMKIHCQERIPCSSNSHRVKDAVSRRSKPRFLLSKFSFDLGLETPVTPNQMSRMFFYQ
jgi:hypothetical protein